MAQKRDVAVIVLISVVASGAGRGLVAQSLGEAARKEKEKRGAARTASEPVRKYSDQDLETYAGERPVSAGLASGEAPATSAILAAAPEEDQRERDEANERSEAQRRKADTERLRRAWHEARERVARAKRVLKAMEEDMRSYPAGDPGGSYRGNFRAERAGRYKALESAKDSVRAAQDQLDAIEIEASRKSIPLN
jgi:hypothetical protein